jgi:hypothetical protein
MGDAAPRDAGEHLARCKGLLHNWNAQQRKKKVSDAE